MLARNQPLIDDDPREMGPYELVARIGSGGMGRVYLARTADGRELAVKVVRAEFADDVEFRHRFRQEVAAARRVHGAFTAAVVDADTEGDRPWLATAYVPGPSLHETVTTHGPMPARSVRLLACGLAEALRSIHAVGLVHRDLKPSNVLLAADGPRVIDFGIARAVDATSLTRTGVSIGSPQFMAPEQATGAPVTAATDVFALGAVIVFAATGRAPFGDGAAPAVLYRVVHESPDLSGLPPDLCAVASACLDKDPGKRPTLDDVVRRCGGTDPATVRVTDDWLPETITRHLPAPTRPLPADQPGAEPVRTGVRRWPRRSRRRRAFAALGVAVVECAVAVVMAKVLPAAGLVAALTAHVHDINTVAFSPDGHTVASAGNDGTVRLWNVTDPEQATLLGQPLNLNTSGDGRNGIDSVAFSPDGHMLASADGIVRLWRVTDPAHPTALGRLDHDKESYSYLAFSPDGRTVATGGSAVQLWTDVGGRFPTAHAPLPLVGSGGETFDYALAFSPDGHTVAVRGTTAAGAGDENPIQLWNVGDPDHPFALGQVPAGRRTPFHLSSLAFSRDGKVLAAGNYDGTVQLWSVADLAHPTTLGTPVTGDTHIVNSVAFSPNGNVLAVGGFDGTVRLWNVADPAHPTQTGQPLAYSASWPRRLIDHSDIVRSVTFSPDGRFLAVGAATTVQLWDCRLAGCLGT